jgi:hypothetical protein
LGFVVEIQAIERDLVGQGRRTGSNVKALAAHAPAIAQVDILMDMRLIKVDQVMTVALRIVQQRVQLVDEGRTSVRIGPAE